ncbi:transcriptional regulator [Metasolibacillus meyeri]|uniref:Transcriptional regulator n=1 Tax=Metasolibacillus meyeri TaxID=1071052 RepID=A0AAW9NW36_9BACL|nr:transcriptional regulator [Metasolibacillus meyeri]MEC1178508.1 transcriptional regulator [Metasolibacillus meyeri]
MEKRQLTPQGKQIVKRLIDMGKTQVWLCEQVGTSKVYLNFILRGERSGEKYLKKIYEVLDLQEEEQHTA